MHVRLVLRADALEGCTENSEEARELEMIAEAIEAYETRRWPDGKVPGYPPQKLQSLKRCGLGKPRPVIGTRPSSVGSSPDPGRLGSRAAQRVASP